MVTNRKRLFSNFFSLGIIQGTNYLLPILITPYVIKRIGADGFGIIAVTQVVMMFFQTISDYSFSLTATRDVSQNRETRTVLSRIFYTVLIMYVSLFARLVFVALVLIFIRSKPDYIYFLFFTGVGNVLAGSVSIILAIRMLRLKRIMPSRKDILHELKNGWHIMTSALAVSSYTYINVIALRLFYSDTVVGCYSVAEKKRALFAVFISGTIINLIMNMCIVRIYGPVGTSFIILITECLVTAGLVGAMVINPKLGILKFLRSHARTS
jgi:PST family polysaccharide transporter